MVYSNEITELRNRLCEDYIALVKKYGNGKQLSTFNLCCEYGLMLDYSTIDKIGIVDEELLFYYNENEDDCFYPKHFSLEELAQFYDGLVDALEHEEER